MQEHVAAGETPGEGLVLCDPDVEDRSQMTAALEVAGYTVTELACGEDLLEWAHLRRPLGVVLEVNLPGVSGYEACWSLRKDLGPSLPVVFVSGDRTEPRDRVAGLLLGADDYLVKPCDPGELVARIRSLLRRVTAPVEASVRQLTARELDVVRLLADGLDQREIAAELVISPKTVGSHLESVFKKLDVRSRAQVVALAYREGLVRGSPKPPLASAP